MSALAPGHPRSPPPACPPAPQLSQTHSPGLTHWPSLQMVFRAPTVCQAHAENGGRRCSQFTPTQERAQTQRTDMHSKLREVRAWGPAGRGPPARFIGPKEPTQKGGVRSAGSWGDRM